MAHKVNTVGYYKIYTLSNVTNDELNYVYDSAHFSTTVPPNMFDGSYYTYISNVQSDITNTLKKYSNHQYSDFNWFNWDLAYSVARNGNGYILLSDEHDGKYTKELCKAIKDSIYSYYNKL